MTYKSAKYSGGMALAFLSLVWPLTLIGQTTVASEKAESKPRPHPVEVTGCLQKTNESGEFSITGEDGKTWDLRSTEVNLSKHVGHKVTLTGTPYRETPAEEAKEEKTEKNGAAAKQSKEAEEKAEKNEAAEKGPKEAEEPHLRVTGLKMISQTCSK